MCHIRRKKTAQPLSAEDAQEMRDEGLEGQLVEVDGLTYDGEDLYRCDGCGCPAPDPDELDDDGFCEECAADAGPDVASDESWAYRHSVL